MHTSQWRPSSLAACPVNPACVFTSPRAHLSGPVGSGGRWALPHPGVAQGLENQVAPPSEGQLGVGLLCQEGREDMWRSVLWWWGPREIERAFLLVLPKCRLVKECMQPLDAHTFVGRETLP